MEIVLDTSAAASAQPVASTQVPVQRERLDHGPFVIGAYAVKLSMFDVWIMFTAGVVGWLFSVFKFPVAPVVLGVILAPLADENIRRSLLIFEDKTWGFVLSQWIGTVLMLAVLFVIVEGALRVMRSSGRSEHA